LGRQHVVMAKEARGFVNKGEDVVQSNESVGYALVLVSTKEETS
jgi:hypothetical protein